MKTFKKNISTHCPTEAVTPAQLQDATVKAVKNVYNPEFFANRMQEKLVEEMSEPQIVLADTNWGSAESHTFFVIAPDPVSGEPMMWQKTDPPGKMRKLGGKWLQASWGLLE